jgi:hypothetical protein
MTISQHDQDMRRALFTVCETKEQLARWVRVFLKIDLPDAIVSDESNSCPMDLLWELYNKARLNNDESFSRVMAYANRGGGKCVKKGTMLRYRDRTSPIEKAKVGDEIWSGFAWRKVTDWIHDGEKESVTLNIRGREPLTTSTVHRVWCLTESGPDWVRVNDLKPGDRVALDVNTTTQYNLIPSEYDQGYILGILAGDGCLAFLDRGHVTLSTADKYVLSRWVDFCVREAGRPPKQSKTRPYDWRINSVQLCSKLKEMGCRQCHSFDKETPALITTFSHMSGFLSGLFDTDGSIHRNRMVLELTSLPLINSTHKFLTALGIDSRVKVGSKLRGLQKHLVHKLTVTAEDFSKLQEVNIKIMAGKAQRFIPDLRSVDTGNAIPKRFLQPLLSKLPTKGSKWRPGIKKPSVQYPRLSVNKIEKLIAYAEKLGLETDSHRTLLSDIKKFRWAEVESITVGRDEFFDLTVEEDHCYWSNGFVSHNTLSASIYEVLVILHLRRNAIHMAAIFDQAKKSQEYVRDFFNAPYIRDFRTGQNVKKIEVCYFKNKKGEVLTEKEWLELSEINKIKFERNHNYIQIVLCTLASSNGAHGEFMCADELDVIPKQNRNAYEESKHIPDSRNGILPITLLTSTRKFSYGLVQQEITKAAKTGLHVRHWNAIDIVQKCQPDRHLPDLPKKTYYINDSELRHVCEEDYLLLDEKEKERYYSREGFAGCLACPIFPACKGRLATHQTGASTMLKPISTAINSFKSNNLSQVQTQILCRQPDESGLIYPKYNREIHMKTASEMAAIITGNPYPQNISKSELLDLLVGSDARFYAGMDFGFTHDFSVVLGAVWGKYLLVVTVISMAGLELDEKIKICDPIKRFNPVIYGDPEAPADIKTFGRRGFNMRGWKKYPGSVKNGIEIVRMKLRPASGDPQMFFLKDDPGCEALGADMSTYHFMTDAAGQISEEPDDENDDKIDAHRYLVMNVFAPKGKILKESTKDPVQTGPTNTYTPEAPTNWMAEKIASLVGEGETSEVDTEPVRRGRFSFDLA